MKSGGEYYDKVFFYQKSLMVTASKEGRSKSLSYLKFISMLQNSLFFKDLRHVFKELIF